MKQDKHDAFKNGASKPWSDENSTPLKDIRVMVDFACSNADKTLRTLHIYKKLFGFVLKRIGLKNKEEFIEEYNVRNPDAPLDEIIIINN